MASISTDSEGRRVVQFTAPDGKRKSIRLGKVSMKIADGVRTKVESLVSAALSRLPLDDETSRWLAMLDTVMVDKLAACGLIPGRARIAMPTLAEFVSSYIAKRTDCKPGTIRNYRQAERQLIEFFGTSKRLDEVTSADADDWRRALLAKDLAENTVRSFSKCAKAIGKYAVDKNLIVRSPFAGLKGGTRREEARLRFVTKEETERLLQHCPDAEWRLIVALARYGGLRTPSESNALRWDGIDWEHDRMTVYSPKTEHHSGGESRVVPIFAELRPYLAEAFEKAEDGAEFVIAKYRDRSNLRTRFMKIIRRAGVESWPKPFQNLRSSRQTELAQTFPSHVVCKWIGNSEAVAQKHYLQVTEDHFRQAVSTDPGALQNPVQSAAESVGNSRKPQKSKNEKTPVFPGFSACCHDVQSDLVPLRGFDGNAVSGLADNALRTSDETSAAKSGAVAANIAKDGNQYKPFISADADLTRLIAAWPSLSQVVKRKILRFVL